MTITDKQAIKAIENRISELKHVKSGEDYSKWESITLTFLSRIYGRTSIQLNKLDGINRHYYVHGVDHSHYIKDTEKACNYLNGLLQEIRILGCPSCTDAPPTLPNDKHPPINVNVSQNQQQTVNLELVIEQALQELPEEILEQIREIVKQGGTKETVLQKVIKVLGSLEIGVASSCLATILMNYYWG